MGHTKITSKRADRISPFHVMDILAQARQLESQGHNVIHLEVGEPDFTTPEAVKQAAKQAIDQNLTFYTPATGLPELRETIARYYREQLNTDVQATNIILTPGASGALQLTLSCLLNPGDQVMMADPGYPCNRHFVSLLDGVAQTVNVTDETDFQLTHSLIERHWEEQTRVVLLASPSNPTGTLISRDQMQKIIALVEQKKGVLLVDEIYQGLVYDQPDFTAAEFSRHVFVINSFSKFFAMTGWRLGWLVVPDDYISAVDRLAQNLFLAPPTISQYAAIEAFSASNLQLLNQRREALRKRRDFLLQGLKELGFEVQVKPGGAFYIYARVTAFTDDSFSFCRDLLNQAHVAITPGIDFGDNLAHQYVRFAYTQEIDQLQLALDRISSFLATC